MSDTLNRNDDPLVQAILAADVSSTSPLPNVSASGLLTVVRRRRRRLVQVRATAGLLVGFAVCGIVMRASLHRISDEGPPLAQASPSLSIEQVQLELAQLEREAAVQRQVVRGLTQSAAMGKLQAERAYIEEVAEPALLAEETARSAAISWRYAAMVEQESGEPSQALREYRSVAERFPGTEWAELAASSIERLSANDRDKPSL